MRIGLEKKLIKNRTQQSWMIVFYHSDYKDPDTKKRRYNRETFYLKLYTYVEAVTPIEKKINTKVNKTLDKIRDLIKLPFVTRQDFMAKLFEIKDINIIHVRRAHEVDVLSHSLLLLNDKEKAEVFDLFVKQISSYIKNKKSP